MQLMAFETKIKAAFENDGRHFYEQILFRDSLPLKLKKIPVHIKLTKHRLRKLFLFLRHQESERLKLVNSSKRGQKFVHKRSKRESLLL